MRPYLRVANVFEDFIDTSDVMEMNFEDDDYERFRLHPGDILLNEGQSRELVGRPAMYRGELPGACFTNSLIRFRAGRATTPEFALALFRHYLRSGKFMPAAQLSTNIAHLGAGRFAAMPFPLPPLPEQRRIVKTIEAALHPLSTMEREAATQRQRLDELDSAILAKAFRGELV